MKCAGTFYVLLVMATIPIPKRSFEPQKRFNVVVCVAMEDGCVDKAVKRALM